MLDIELLTKETYFNHKPHLAQQPNTPSTLTEKQKISNTYNNTNGNNKGPAT